MFTGIVRALGTVEQIRPQDGSFRLSVRSADLPWRDYSIGESICVNGVCLTAVTLHAAGFDADVSSETMNVTAMGELKAGSRVNLEPSLAVGDRMGGHLVSGHVDCVGTVRESAQDAGSIRLRIGLPGSYLRYIVKKGSVCVDGVSLTINEVSADSFTANIIPHTAEATIAGSYEVGASVNIEVDLIARYLEGLLAAGHGEGEDKPLGITNGITKEFLRAHGYA
jgi:riboflavin synthase